MTAPHRVFVAIVAATGFTAALSADTLFLRNGQRVQGELVSVEGRVITFEENRGFAGRRLREFDRDDVVRIDLEAARVPGGPPVMVRPPGMRERVVNVAANLDWTDTGVEVRINQEIYFEASGRVRWGRDRMDSASGEPNSPTNPNRPIPSRPAAALIGKIGKDSTDVFFIGGETGPIRMRAGGRLFLGINDDVLTDNSGNFRVVVYY